jgi:hypothetical protein
VNKSVLAILLILLTGVSAAVSVDVPGLGAVEIPFTGGGSGGVEVDPSDSVLENRGTGQAEEPPSIGLNVKNDSTLRSEENNVPALDAPNRSHVVASDMSGSYETYYIGRCYGLGSDKDSQPDGTVSKGERVFANSFAENTSSGARWVDPDASSRTIERGGLSCDLTGDDWGVVRSGRLLEEGGTISGLNLEDSGGRETVIRPYPSGSTLCIGQNCDKTRGSATSRDTDDTSVDSMGDSMDGTLRTDKLHNVDSLCIGENCGGSDVSADSESISFENKEMSGALLRAPDIAPRGARMCIGEDCEPAQVSVS